MLVGARFVPPLTTVCLSALRFAALILRLFRLSAALRTQRTLKRQALNGRSIVIQTPTPLPSVGVFPARLASSRSSRQAVRFPSLRPPSVPPSLALRCPPLRSVHYGQTVFPLRSKTVTFRLALPFVLRSGQTHSPPVFPPHRLCGVSRSAHSPRLNTPTTVSRLRQNMAGKCADVGQFPPSTARTLGGL